MERQQVVGAALRLVRNTDFCSSATRRWRVGGCARFGKAGYDGVISIEHEDPRHDGEEGTSRLRRRPAIAQLAEAA